MSARYPKSSNNTPPVDESSVGDDSYRWLKQGSRDDIPVYIPVARWAGLGPPESLPRGTESRGVGSEVPAPPLKSTSIHLTDDSGTIEFTRLNGREYEGKLREISWGRPRKCRIETISNRGRSLNWERNRISVIKRAKTQIRRMVMHNNLNYMISGTTRECIGDREKFGPMVSEWERRVKHFIPGWETLIVLEKQKRGAYHFHAAVHGWQRLMLMKKLWWDIVGGEGEGFIQVEPPPGGNEGNAQWKIVKLAQYLCKYIDKAVGADHEFDKKTYWHTQGVDNPPVTSILVESGSEEFWANRLIQFIPGMKKHIWTDYNGAIGRVANF